MISQKIKKNKKKFNKSFLGLLPGLIIFIITAPLWVPLSLKLNLLSYPFSHNKVITLGTLLLGGYIGGEIAGALKFPAVTGYIIMGIFLGPFAFGTVSSHLVEGFHFLEALGLSLVALIIGGDLHYDSLRKIGKTVVVITFVQALSTFLIVILAVKCVLHLSTPIALLLGAIASATAPAATVAIIKEFKAKGPLTDTLVAIVAMDDAVCIILFALVAAFVGLSHGGKGGQFSLSHITLPLWELGGSISFGILMGIILTMILRKKLRKKHEITIILVGSAFLFGEFAEIFGLSSLLFNMTIGLTMVNLDPNPLFLKSLEEIELPIFILFFALAGASLNLKVLIKNWQVGAIFVLARAIGKIGGVYLGGKLSGARKTIQNYLGLAMLPQAGVAIALALTVQVKFPDISNLITAVVLASVAINELIGPLGTKCALTAAGETNSQRATQPTPAKDLP